MPSKEVHKVQKIRRNVQSCPEMVDAHIRGKDFITEAELKRLVVATKNNRYHWRDAAIFQLIFWHGLRVTELCNLRLSDIDFDAGRIFVRRLKGSLDTHQPLLNDELRALKKYLKQREGKTLPPLFLTERGTAFTRS